MATLSNQNTVATNQTTFSFITPIKLDRSNYMLWKNQVLASIRGNRLEGYINGEKIAPNRFIASSSFAGATARAAGSSQQIENPEYTVWIMMMLMLYYSLMKPDLNKVKVKSTCLMQTMLICLTGIIIV